MNNEPVGYIPDIALPTLTKEKSYCVINATKLDESDIPLYTHPVNPYQSITNTKIEPTVVSYTHPVELIDDEKKKYFPFQLKNHVLTDEEIMDEYKFGDNHGSLEFARAIESMVVHRLKVKELSETRIKQIFVEQTGFYFDDNPADDLALMDFAKALLLEAQEK